MKLLLISFLAVAFISCKKEGTGGKATLVAFPAHHHKPIYGATVYVKFGAKEFPGENESNYDLKIVASPKEDHVHIENLKWGNYYLYATGYDSAIAMPVTGGIPFTLKYSESTKEVSVEIPVTE